MPGRREYCFFSYRIADAAEGAELLLSNDAYFDGLSQNDIDFRMQRKGATLEEFKAFAAEQALDFTDAEKAQIDAAMADIERFCRERGVRLPAMDGIVFIKTSMLEECGAGGYTHGTQVYMNQYWLDWDATGEPEGQEEFRLFLAHELFHCLTRNHPEFRREMYALLGFTVVDEDYDFAPSVRERIISNPDVEHHNAFAAFEIDGEMRDCVVVFATDKPFEQPGDSFFDEMVTGLVPVDDLGVMYTSDEAANFWDVFGKNTDNVIDPEETLADNFAYAIVFGQDGQDYATPELIGSILDCMSAE